MIETWLPKFYLLTASAVAPALVGLMAHRVATGRGAWLWRVTPLVLLLAAIAPIGAYPVMAILTVQAVFVIGGLSIRRLIRARRARRHDDRIADGPASAKAPGSFGRQFLLRDMLFGVLLAAAVLAILRHAADDPTLATDSFLDGGVTIAGAALAAVTLAATWLVWGRARRVRRILLLLLVTTTAGLLVAGSFRFIYKASLGGVLETGGGQLTLVVIGQCVLTVAALWLVTRAGWDWRGCLSPAAEVAQWTAGRGRLAARIAVCALALAIAGILVPVYRGLLPPTMPAQEPLPNPNGYDDIMLAGKLLNWAAIPGGDPDEATICECQAFVQANAAAFALIRQGLDKPCRCPAGPNQAFFLGGSSRASPLRWLARALVVEGRTHEAAGRHEEAARSYGDCVRLGYDTSRGGLITDELVGYAIEGVGLDWISKEMNQLTAPQLGALGSELESLADSREPLDVIVARDRLFGRLVLGWQGRLNAWLNDDLFAQLYAAARDRVDARLRLIIAEAAVRRYVLIEGSPPETLAALVPEYLAAVPQDPYGTGPLVYRRTNDGYLLYSVGSNGIDDGGQRVSAIEATHDGKGDLFFDAPSDPDTNSASDAANPAADENPDENEPTDEATGN